MKQTSVGRAERVLLVVNGQAGTVADLQLTRSES